MPPAGGPSSDPRDARDALVERLGVTFRDPDLFELALTHRSYAYEQDVADTNERLELLGDAVLDFVVTDLIFRRFPSYVEGDLAKLRASLVSAPTLAEVAAGLGLGEAVKLGRGEVLTGGREKPSILADALEALIGAVYIDRGMTVARRVVRDLFGDRIAAAVGQEVPKDAKTRLQERVTRLVGALPAYRVTGYGPDHAKRFRAEVLVRDEVYGRGEGRSKKEAEQAAAAEAVAKLATELDGVVEGA
ncbi:MAG TPA: ribonuclease III [Actinomycetota bacterium]|jgi:ribonuclease III|nr:ribonuclease III [Actinomycetota bacterium]